MWRLLGARGERSLPRAGEAAGLARPGRDAEGGDRPVGSLPWGLEGIRVPVQARTIWVRVSRAGHVMTMAAKQLPRVGGALAPSVRGARGLLPAAVFLQRPLPRQAEVCPPWEGAGS